MTTINAQTIVNTLAAAAAIAPEYRDELTARAMPEWMMFNKAAPWGFDGADEFAECDDGQQHQHKAYAASNAAQEVGRDVVTRALCQVRDLLNVPARIKIQTSARGSMTIQNTRERLEKFAETVRKNAAAFGGGLVRIARPRAAVTWPAGAVKMVRELIQDHDYTGALDLASAKCGALFYQHKKEAFMLLAPVECADIPGMMSAQHEKGHFVVFEPVSGFEIAGAYGSKDKARAAAIAGAITQWEKSTNHAEAIAKAHATPGDQAAARLAWMTEHGITESADTTARIETQQNQDAEAIAQAIEAAAAQDVAQVVAIATAAAAIEQASESAEQAQVATVTDTTHASEQAQDVAQVAAVECAELATCEAGGSEASGVTVGSATWAPIPQYVPCPPNRTGFNDGPAPAFRGHDGDTPTPPPAEFFGDATPPVAISTDYASDIPLSLAVSAYNGVSMSPERRGASAKSEYADSMAADYEKLHAQAIKGGTLDLLPEVFARYRARQSSAYKAYLASSSRCVSSFIAGPANFPVARMQKRNDIAHKRLNEYLDGGKMALQSAIRQLRPDLRAIMSGDADAIDRLTIEIEAAERLQSQMKACNKAIRATEKMDEAHKVAALMEIGYSENQAIDILHPAYKGRGVGFPSYRLTNNQANIRRMRARLEQITAAKARPVESVECANGVTLEDDAPANRVRLFFPGKPAEAIRDELKASGFRWAPSVGAWQAYRNYGTLATARRMAGEPIEAEESTVDAVEVEEVAPPPAVESQPVAPVVVSKPNSEGERIPAAADKMRDQFPAIAAKYDDLATSHDLKDEREAQQVQNVPETPQGQQVIGKSGKWSAYLYTWHDGKPWMTFEATSGAYECNGYATASERMKALQALARAADAPTDTPPGGGLPRPEPVAAPEPVASVAPTPTVAVSSASPTPPVAVRRNFIPDNGLHIVDDAFEAWTFPWEDRFSFVMYLGKSAKPWKMFSYSTEAKRDDGFNRYATDARAIALSKADRKAQSKAQADKPHGLQVGDVVRSSWGYEQTNVNHYQIVKVIGKRTVEVRALAVHEEATGGMTGRVAPVHGEFVGEVMRRTVDARGDVNMLSASYGRASKIEPLAIVHGVRCYAASGYSSHA